MTYSLTHSLTHSLHFFHSLHPFHSLHSFHSLHFFHSLHSLTHPLAHSLTQLGLQVYGWETSVKARIDRIRLQEMRYVSRILNLGLILTNLSFTLQLAPEPFNPGNCDKFVFVSVYVGW